ncbi:DoxX family protein [Pleionea sediminis]|uniref:HvfX family Cu-binding RiPP maturation protein n=1 Tax=Pleionea sediminis TaxID=2569479 RepID=UPI001FE679B3|nr:DoxX family protein [Pleionea sediminis]
MQKIIELYKTALNGLSHASGLGPLFLRVFLVFPFYMAGSTKLGGIEGTAAWFEHSLELPFPLAMAYLAAITEYLGAILLAIGLATRFIAIPLIITMLVAALTAHWDNGWYAIAQSSDPEVSKRLNAARSILQEHGNYDWLTAKGSFVILNNGIEFAVTYLVMLISLFFTGGGKYFSVDYWIGRKFLNR